jgi:hypothetical protein
MDWYFYERKELIMETKPKQKWLNLADLTKKDGELVMMVKAKGQTVNSYKTRVTGGKLQGLERSRLGFELARISFRPAMSILLIGRGRILRCAICSGCVRRGKDVAEKARRDRLAV